MDFIDYDLDYSSSSYNTPPNLPNHQHSSSPSSTDILTSYRCVLLNYPVNTSYSPSISYYTLWLLNSNPLYPPADFTPFHHVAFQFSQFLLLLFVLCFYSGLFAYAFLTFYLILEVLWGAVILKSLDLLVWGCLIIFVIICKLLKKLICGGSSSKRNTRHVNKSPAMRRVKSQLLSAHSNDTEIDLIYTRLFAPVRVSYKQFSRVVGCKRGFKNLAAGENYAVEKRSRVDSLGLLVGGRLVVSQGGKPLHVILPYQFVDSPEYFGVATDELFQVTITALEDSKLLVWHRDKLRLTIMNDEFLRVMFDHIIGRDGVRKLIQVSDTIMTTTTTVSSTSSSSSTTTTSAATPSSPSSSNNQNNVLLLTTSSSTSSKK